MFSTVIWSLDSTPLKDIWDSFAWAYVWSWFRLVWCGWTTIYATIQCTLIWLLCKTRAGIKWVKLLHRTQILDIRLSWFCVNSIEAFIIYIELFSCIRCKDLFQQNDNFLWQIFECIRLFSCKTWHKLFQ